MKGCYVYFEHAATRELFLSRMKAERASGVNRGIDDYDASDDRQRLRFYERANTEEANHLSAWHAHGRSAADRTHRPHLRFRAIRCGAQRAGAVNGFCGILLLPVARCLHWWNSRRGLSARKIEGRRHHAGCRTVRVNRPADDEQQHS